MCTGLELIGLIAGPVMSGIGAAIQQREMARNQQRMAEARNNELRRTLAKNDALAERSREVFEARRRASEGPELDKAEQEAKEKRSQELQVAAEQTPAPAADIPLAGSTPQVVQSDIAKRFQNAINQSKDQADKLGILSGYGDMWLNQGFADAQAGRELGTYSNFASGNMALLPYQQDIAEMRAYKPISPIGGILQGVGGMLSSYGGGGGLPKRSYTSPTYFYSNPGLW